jgi:D-glycero-alpha-D-manno-heptose 1-phosphate guanylyltransferase
MEIVILAGGLGTRLQGVVNDVPKPMAPIKGKPFLDYLLKWMLKYPVSKIVFSVGYKADVIKSHFGNVYEGIPVAYAEEIEPLGTGGAIVNAFKFTTDDDILVVNGDTYFPIDLDIFYKSHTNSKNKFTIAIKKMENFDRYGTVELSGNTITGFKEKQPLDKGLINGGIYVTNKDFVESKLLPPKFSLEQEVLELEAQTGNLKAMIFTDTFIDIGVPEDYQQACDQL